jgi:serine protease Do
LKRRIRPALFCFEHPRTIFVFWSMKFIRALIGVSTLMLALTALIVAVHFVAHAAATAPAIRVDSKPVTRDAASGNNYGNIVKQVAPSVVNIYSSRTIHQQYHSNPWYFNPLVRQMWGDNVRDFTRQLNWLGSGMIVTPDGYILTANHVVEGADEIKVGISSNKTEYAAQIIGTDPQTDVAVLKIDAQNLPAITLGDSAQIEVGDAVLAIGNPLGLGQTVTHGIVSALGRSVPMQNSAGYPARYQDFIQTDAAINHGNSGGALVDAQGRLIGINDAIIEGGNGIGFAIPVNMARNVMEGFLNGGKVVRGFIGISPQDLDDGLARSFSLQNSAGALVAETAANAPAETAGIKSGDIILAINGQSVVSAENFRALEAQLPPDTAASVKIFRNGTEKIISVTPIGRLDAVAASFHTPPTAPKKSIADLLKGVHVYDLNSELRDEIAAPLEVTGAVITEVDNGSNAESAGLLPGDVILEINRQSVSNAEDAKRLGLSATGERILVKIWRNNGTSAGTRFVSVDNTRSAK